jgi:hypothetical protein
MQENVFKIMEEAGVKVRPLAVMPRATHPRADAHPFHAPAPR